MMIDYCMQKFFNMPYDKDGKIAKSGNISSSWLDCLLQDEYYFRNPPKTTGREYFSGQYIENALRFAPEKPQRQQPRARGKAQVQRERVALHVQGQRA